MRSIFLSALAAKINLTGVTYNSLLAGQVADLVAALLTAQRNTNGNTDATIALSSVANAVAGLTTKVSPVSLIDPGSYAALPTGQKPKASVMVSMYNLLSAVGMLANGNHQIATALAAGLAGIASVLTTIGEQPGAPTV